MAHIRIQGQVGFQILLANRFRMHGRITFVHRWLLDYWGKSRKGLDFFNLLSCITSQLLFSLPPLLSVPHASSPRSTSPLFPLKKRAGLLGISAEHGITSYNKTRQKPSYQGSMRKSSRRKRVPKASKKKSDIPHAPPISSPLLALLEVAQEHPGIQCICRRPSSDPDRICDYHFTLYDPHMSPT